MKAGANWSIAVPNGWYDVRVSVGDAAMSSVNTIRVQGASYWTNLGLAANKFAFKTLRVRVTNGKLTITNGAGADLATRINFVDITAVVGVNFQANGSPLVNGYNPDYGQTYGPKSDGLTYGWNTDHSALDRDRNVNSNQLLDTLVHMKASAQWTIDVPNGKYSVTVSVGDSSHASVHTLNVNGVNAFNNVSLAANKFATKSLTVTVSNGKLVIDNGASGNEHTRINYVNIWRVG
jgi:hypothetical protein